jgi:chorismate lyase
VLDWLGEQGSLTRRVQLACPGRFWVEVLRQERRRPYASEVALLRVRPTTRALVREVRLHCAQASWVYARTLIPVTSLRGAARRLTLLGSRPLGAVLFADPSAVRLAMEFACLLPGHLLFETAVAGLSRRPPLLWGRRTLFRLAGKPLLVNEIFLPELFGEAG